MEKLAPLRRALSYANCSFLLCETVWPYLGLLLGNFLRVLVVFVIGLRLTRRLIFGEIKFLLNFGLTLGKLVITLVVFKGRIDFGFKFAAYTYDARNRLLNAGGVTNAYDAMNNRVGQTYGTNTAIFVVNPNAKLPQILMRIKNGVTNYYIYGSGLLYQVTETATATNTLTYHFDSRGSTIALTDGNGNVTDRMGNRF